MSTQQNNLICKWGKKNTYLIILFYTYKYM